MSSADEVVRAQFDRFARDNFVPGAVIVLVVPDRGTGQPITTVTPCGLADLAARRPVTADTIFEIGSLSKVFTGALLAGATTDGPVRLDQPVQDFTRVQVPSGRTAAITVGHLATHRSGLPKRPPGLPRDAEGRAAYSAAQLWSDLGRTALTFEPGDGWQYSNMGFGLLGTVLAQVAGRTYAQLVADLLTTPLLMSSTKLDSELPPMSAGPTVAGWFGRRTAGPQREASVLDRATGYRKGSTARAPLPAAYWMNTGALAGSGGLVSTGTDLAAFVRASLGYTDAPVSAWLERSQQPLRTGGAGDATEMCLGWQLRTAANYPNRFAFKNGGTEGTHSAMALDRAATGSGGIGVAILSNSPIHVDPLAITLLRTARDLATGAP